MYFIILPSAGWYDGDKWKDDVSAYQSASLMETSNAYFIRWVNNKTNTMPTMFYANPEFGYSVRPVNKSR